MVVRFRESCTRRITWMLLAALAAACVSAPTIAQDEPPPPPVSERQADGASSAGVESAAPAEPIFVTPEYGAQAPVVQLEPGAELVPWSPLEINEFALLDQNGDPVTAADLRGKPWVASFIFTRCPIACPNLVKKIYDLDRRVKDVDVRFVTITVDPEHDTVAKMKQYADIYQAKPERWLFLTGDKAEVNQLIRHGFKVAAWENFGTERMPGFEFAHSLSLVHVGPDGKVLGMYASADENELRSLERVLAGKIETPPENRPVPPDAVPEGKLPPSVNLPPARPRSAEDKLPPWAARLPATNAMLNALATVLLLVGFTAIQAGHVGLHKKLMLYAFGVSVAFLTLYLVHKGAMYHYTGQFNTKMEASGNVLTLYLCILASHVLLAITVPFLAGITIYRGLKKDWDRHRRIAKITFPIWLYVSVTGVIIYGMLYHWPK